MVLRPEQNVGPTKNFLSVHNAARGEYVAPMDGDDVALPGKLARQAAFLDKHPDVVVCGHRAGIILEDGSKTDRTFPFRLKTILNVSRVIWLIWNAVF